MLCVISFLELLGSNSRFRYIAPQDFLSFVFLDRQVAACSWLFDLILRG